MSEETGNGDGHRELTTEEMAALIVEGGQVGYDNRESQHEAGGSRPTIQQNNVLELHVCMGLNACAKHDVTKQALLPGSGRCATVQHVCHGDNNCRGQGGCGYLGAEYEQSIPGEQSCAENGSCASPINESRVHSAGPFKGTSVWKLARKRFEQRMWDAGRPFDPAPGEGCPDAWVPEYEDRRKMLGEIRGQWHSLLGEQADDADERADDSVGQVELHEIPEFEGGA